MSVAAAWIRNNWIYSDRPEQNGRYFIDEEGRIWGPVGTPEQATGCWIHEGWIWKADEVTEFWVAKTWIYGPEMRLPFARD